MKKDTQKKSDKVEKVKITEIKKPNATPNETMFKKLTPIYSKIKIKEEKLMPGIYYHYFENIPKELSLNDKSAGHVLYLDNEEMAIGKIKKVYEKYCSIFVEDRSFPFIDLFLNQVIKLKDDTKLYKKNVKK